MTLRRNLAVPLPPAEYGAEVLCAGWNPAAVGALDPAVRVQERRVEAVVADAESFLALFYRAQQA